MVSISARLTSLSPLDELRARRDEHPIWRNQLFQACEAGALDREDLKYVFSQYQLYSRNFTRYISALMANCESDLFRARLSENLWEEGGGCAPEKRHAELFRRFLKDALGVVPEDTEFDMHTQYFAHEYLRFCQVNDALAASAFLSLGTEGIVPRMYTMLMHGLTHAGIPDSELEFFKIHIECDDGHAETLEELMLSYLDQPNWFDRCRDAMNRALDLRLQFFDRCVEELQRRRLDGLLSRVNNKVSLCPLAATARDVCHRGGIPRPALYRNRSDADGIDFAVDRIPLAAEVLDPRHVMIPAGKRNECHRHAHETFIYFLDGSGQVAVDAQTVQVTAGDSVLVPRWALHQTSNTGTVPLRFIAITDYHLTKRAFVGDAQAYRLDETANRHRVE
jgi:pyrroloquinoline quinone (PQQ) biosynthesis protein C/mannose-6-phosphate isomerase-like protein (cupin superfamily)